jgi:alkanesulfonate monooxygenase SsuD/methylene tetrahydromethanopterin reductase-like flavin-dependent oxidoreductase (luciferase family)
MVMNNVSSHVPGSHPWVAEGQKKLRFGTLSRSGTGDWIVERDFAQAADELGFDTYWVGDHPSMSADCWARLSALAASTRQIRLASIACAPIRGPHWLARLAADVDRISDGRLILGLGAGWAEGEFNFFGQPFRPAGDRLRFVEETVQEIGRIWVDPPTIVSTLTMVGGDTTISIPIEARFTVSSLFQPYIPILIAGAGEKVILRQVADYADMCDIEVGKATAPEAVHQKLAALRGHCEVRGRSFDTVVRGFHDNLIVVAENESAVAEKVDRVAFLRGIPGFQGCTPRDLIERYRPLIDAGINHFTVSPWVSDPSTLRLIAEKVIPELHEYYATRRRVNAVPII